MFSCYLVVSLLLVEVGLLLVLWLGDLLGLFGVVFFVYLFLDFVDTWAGFGLWYFSGLLGLLWLYCGVIWFCAIGLGFAVICLVVC